MRIKAVVIALLISLIGTTLASCGQSPAQNINEVLEPIRQKYNLPAFAALVILNGKTVTIGAVGVRKYGSDVPVTENDKFHLGSAGKSITATMIAVLVEQGKLKWTTTMAEVFPEFADKMLPKFRSVTLLHLLSHRAGLPTDFTSWPEEAQALTTSTTGTIMERRYKFVEIQLCAEQYASLPEPGKAFVYSNAGYMIAAAVAERVTVSMWEDLVTNLVFKPLGMSTAGFGPQATEGTIDQPWPHLNLATASPAAVEQIKSQTGDPGIKIYPVIADVTQLTAPAGGMHMSIGDWAKYINEHLKGSDEKSKLLTKQTFDTLHTSHFPEGIFALGPELVDAYALGWGIEYNATWAGSTVITHAGSNGLNWAEVWMVPDRKFAVLVMTNIAVGPELTSHDACGEVRDAMVQKYLPKGK